MKNGYCEHNRQQSVCKQCGGVGICEHNKRRSDCVECVGSQICEHKKRRNRCRECGGKGLCIHKHQRSVCVLCSPCIHGAVRTVCKECKVLGIGGGSLCEHFIKKNNCPRCAACIHKLHRNECKICSPCPHGNRKLSCRACLVSKNSLSICEHGIMKGGCRLCNPDNFYKRYRNNAKKRGLEFLLSLEEFKEIIDQPCNYCGSTDSIGIDRNNSEIGYTSKNSVPCCTICNYMKLDYSEEEFLSHVERITSHQIGLKADQSGREFGSTY